MDSVFYLGHEARGRFLRSTARAIRCTYICLWSYQPHPFNCLASIDGWFNDEENEQLSSSSTGGGGGSVVSRLFDTYRTSLCNMESGCVPGLAYKKGTKFVAVQNSELMGWAAAIPEQRQFYQEAGIKTAVFMGCKSGEIEIGMSTSTNNMEVDVRSFFTEDIVQKFQLGDSLLQPDQSRPSSSSSSLRSLSVGSPECSSFLLNMANTNSSCMPDAFKEVVVKEQTVQVQPMPTLVQPNQIGLHALYGPLSNTQFPSPASDDVLMMRAMLAVLSSSPNSSSSSINPSPQTHPQTQRQHRGGDGGRAFKPYSSAVARKVGLKPNLSSQSMIKMAHTMLRNINGMRAEAAVQEARPTSNQLHHMISERKRREKLNDSFHTLKSLLPPGTRRDKASILATTKDYLNTLKAQISDLEEKNRALEMSISPSDKSTEESDTADERVGIQITKASQSTSGVDLRVTVRAECDITDLVLHILECLKEMGNISLVSIEANTNEVQMNPFRRVILTLQIKAGNEWDEGRFKEAISMAVDDVAPQPQVATTTATTTTAS